MTENKKVSIIVPVYQAEQFVKECVDAIFKQTYSNIEIIKDYNKIDRVVTGIKNV